jgi:hypothetical protein
MSMFARMHSDDRTEARYRYNGTLRNEPNAQLRRDARLAYKSLAAAGNDQMEFQVGVERTRNLVVNRREAMRMGNLGQFRRNAQADRELGTFDQFWIDTFHTQRTLIRNYRLRFGTPLPR